MTDRAIIQALECCADLFYCIDCPCKEFCGDLGKLQQNALDLLNRQQAEIDNYSHNIKNLIEENLQLHATIKGLQMLLYSFLDTRNGNVVRITDTKLEVIKKPIKAEAIKEFMDRLQGIAYQSEREWSHGEHPMVIELDDAEEIYEEMVGEQG